MEPIRLSAHGRDVHAGDFYNCFDNNILPGPIREPNQNVEISETCEVERFFFYRLPDNYKRYVLGINSHLNQSIEGGKIKSTRVFILKMDYAQDPLIDNMASFIKNRKPFKLPVFWIATIGNHRIEHVIPLLKSFDNLPVTQRSSLDCRYQIGLVSISSTFKNGAVIPFGYPVKELPTEVPAAELPDKPIQPSGNGEKGQQVEIVETSIQPQEISRVFSGSQIGHPPSDPQDYYVSEKSPVPPKHWQTKVGNEEKSDHFNVSFVSRQSNSSLSENLKMNSGCAAAAPMKMVSSHHSPT